MADESSGLWNNLPSLIIVEIFSYVHLKDRLNASSTCKSWRNQLFHPKLWRKVLFQLNSCDNKTVNHHASNGARFLAKKIGHFVRDVIIEVNSSNPKDVQLCKEVLKVLTHNNNLRALSIKPLTSRLEWTDYDDTLTLDQYINALIKIIQNANCLEHLSLGCIEELLDHSDEFLLALGEHQSACLRSLHLASVKEIPGQYKINSLNNSMFHNFHQLQCLSLDYDYLNDQLLDVLSQPHRRPLVYLNVHLHSFNYYFPRVSHAAWKRLAITSPGLEVTLSLLHFHDLRENIYDIFSAEMPLAHFRAYFSSGFRIPILTRLAFLNYRHLRSLVLVDELNTNSSTFLNYRIDPLVMMAWRCKKLSCIKIIGYEIDAESLIGVSRLRGEQLSDLYIPASCISLAHMELFTSDRKQAMEYIQEEVSCGLKRNWAPVSTEDLPVALHNRDADADGVYLDVLLRDQMW